MQSHSYNTTAQQHILKVSELTKKVRFLLESEMHTVWLTGEVSNFVAAASGHWYLSLKDSKAQVKCAMFKGNNRSVRIAVQNGMQVLVKARVSLYEPRGDFQLIIEQLDDAGAGLLQQKFEQLKIALNAEGLFDVRYKQPIPEAVTRVGIVTSPTGAAVKDILTVLKRRNPAIEVIIYPALVQGELAANDIATAIAIANERDEVDVLIVGRGGGSLEDLWAFNEEAVVRAIFASEIPIVSAVGHEIDNSLADFTADLRAATPSAAAEIIASDQNQLKVDITRLVARLKHSFAHRLLAFKHQLSEKNGALLQQDPAQQLRFQQQRCDELQLRLSQSGAVLLNSAQTTSQHLSQRLALQTPKKQLALQAQKHQELCQRLTQAALDLQSKKQQSFANTVHNLNLVSPLATIARGYSITKNQSGEIISATAQVSVNETLTHIVKDGIIKTKVESVEKNKPA